MHLLSYLKKAKVLLYRSTTLKSGIWYLISEFLLRGISFITIPIFTRLLSVEEYGIISVYASVVGIMKILTGANLQAGNGTALIDFKERYLQYRSSVLFLSLFSFASMFLFIFFLIGWLAKISQLSIDLLLLSLMAGYVGFVLYFWDNDLRFRQKYKQRAILNITNAGIQAGLSIVLIILFSRRKYLGRVYGSLIPSFIIAVVIFIFVLSAGRKMVWPKAWKYALKIGIPLIPSSLSGIILAQFDRIAIQSIIGSKEAGLYSFAYNIGMILLILLVAANSAWVPWFFRQKAAGNSERIKKASYLFTMLFLISTIGIMAIGPELALFLAPSNFLASVRIIPVIILSYFFQFLYTLYVNYALFKKKTLIISIGSLLAGGINITLNIWLIPGYGYEIAAWTTVFSYFCLFLFHWFSSSILLREKTLALNIMLLFALIPSAISLEQYVMTNIFEPFSIPERLWRFGPSSICILILLYFSIETYRNFQESQ
ncbi:oligosaccharide flippase family protein [Kosmotoga olearia]|uniref:Polysaccharide biosynthesis protein n=1 Tax=Kosmotoga olearia (strain ATCC BAA-1733 / DSM 21960 / TBF 19.5.1) TaxID=521045 RepID=C5CDB5_KOSOT|nr:oligosaccharide flippase family protein [Kosmotoga olearia]ACR79978.1 polysaccharide biosynthesis protein [Kosmotoga olearia TBF 19.5.1]